MDTTPILIKIPAAASLLGISPTQAYRLLPDWKKQGIAISIGSRSWRINRSRLLEWAGERTVAVA